jgi:hypothetical protein
MTKEYVSFSEYRDDYELFFRPYEGRDEMRKQRKKR